MKKSKEAAGGVALSELFFFESSKSFIPAYKYKKDRSVQHQGCYNNSLAGIRSLPAFSKTDYSLNVFLTKTARCLVPAFAHIVASSAISESNRCTIFSPPSKTLAFRTRQMVQQTKVASDFAPFVLA
jgi:hypothetical protein